MVVIISMLFSSTCAEKFFFSGYHGEMYTDNGVKGLFPNAQPSNPSGVLYIAGKNEQLTPIYIADGVMVETIDNQPAVAHEYPGYTAVRLQGQDDEEWILVPDETLVPESLYTSSLLFPIEYTATRQAVFRTMDETDLTASMIIPAGKAVTVLAVCGGYEYCLYDGNYGYTPFKDQYYICKGRAYDKRLRYTEETFLQGMPDGTESFSAEEAVEKAKAYLSGMLDSDRFKSLDNLKAEARLNVSHIDGFWGKTWQVCFYGSPDSSWWPSPYVVTEEKAETFVMDFSDYLTRDYGFRPDITEDEWQSIRVSYADDIEDRRLFYCVEVLLNSPKCYLITSFNP